MQLYFDEMRAALAYMDSFDWDGMSEYPEAHDWDGYYPLSLYSFMLIDLNFDGIPELVTFGDGAGAGTEAVRIFTINNDKVEMIFLGGLCRQSGEDYMHEFYWQPYRKSSDGSLAFLVFFGAHGSEDEFWGRILLTNNATQMDNSFLEGSIVAEIHSLQYYHDDEIMDFWFFDGREVNEDEYYTLRSNLLIGYEYISYTLHELHDKNRWIVGAPHGFTEDDLWAFLELYTPIRN